MRSVTIAIVAAAAGCKQVKKLEQKVEDKIESRTAAPAPKPHGPGVAAGRYVVAELHVDVKPKHLIREEPDLVLGLYVDGAHVADCRDAHTAHGACRFDAPIALRADSELRVELVDRDGGATLSDPSTWGIELTMPMVPRGDVTGATIVLAPWRSWWDLHGVWVIAGAVAAAAVGGGLFAFRKRLFPPKPVPPPPPTCTHCGKRLARGETRCAHCGAAQ